MKKIFSFPFSVKHLSVTQTEGVFLQPAKGNIVMTSIRNLSFTSYLYKYFLSLKFQPESNGIFSLFV